VADARGEALGGAAAQRRVLALLSLLAAHREAGLSRDKIVGILWPDSTPGRARHSLTQTLYAARRALGIDDLFDSGGDVRLNRARLASDIQEFEAALDADDLERAAELHQGPFLDGFFLSGVAEFEQWTTAQRARLEARATDALERLALRDEQAGDLRRVVAWRRRLAAMQPLDAGPAVKLMTALASAGDRAGAVQHARVYEALLHDQLGLGPDPVVAALAEQLRDPMVWTPAPEATTLELPLAPVAPPTPGDPPVSPPSPAAAEEAGAVADATPAPVAPPRTWRRWAPAGATVVLMAVVAIVAIVAIVALRLGRRPDAGEAEPLALAQKVVVAPFRVAGASDGLTYLRDGMVELLSTRLADDTAARSIDAGAVLGAWSAAGLRGAVDVPRATIVRLAARLGAERVVVGSVVGTPVRAVISASVVAVPSGDIAGEATVEGPVDSLTALVDRLAARLLTAAAGEDEGLAGQTTPSLGALRAFLDGQSAFRRSSYATASRQYERALAADSSFALAGLQLALAGEHLNDVAQTGRGIAAAWASRSALSERDLAQLVALAGPRYPAPSSPADQVAAWEHLVDLTPNRADAWYRLGARLLSVGRAAGLSDAGPRAAAAFRRALALDPGFAPARQLLVEQAVATGADSSLAAVMPPAVRDSLGPFAVLVRWRAAVTRNDAVELRRIRDSLPLFGPATLRAMALTSLYDGVGLDDGADAVHALRQRAVRVADRVDLALAEHAFAVNQGRPRAALAAALALRDLQPTSHATLRLRVLDALYAEGDADVAAAAARELARETAAEGTKGAAAARRLADLCVLAQWRTAHDDTVGVAEAVARLRAARAPSSDVASLAASASPGACAELVDAALAVAQRRRDAAGRVARLDSLLLVGPAAGDAAVWGPLLSARLHERVGDVAGALEAIRRRAYMSGWSPYLTTMWREEGRLAERTGDVAAARAAYARYLSLRDRPESSAEAVVDTVRRAAAALPR